MSGVPGNLGQVLMRLIIEADGGSRGNPGIAGSGTAILDADSGVLLASIAKFIGVATNNVAEYVALLSGLEYIHEHHPHAAIEVRMDSKLVIEQMSGNWKIKHPDMMELAQKAQQIAREHNVVYRWIPREQNSRADALANKAMDERTDSISQPGGTEASAPTNSSVTEFNSEAPSSVRAPGGVSSELTTLILVRHGRTSLTESKRISGRGGADPSLSEAGLNDAAKAATAISQIGVSGVWQHLPKPTAIVSSPIRRTVETATEIARALDLSFSTEDDIAEISFGSWDGLTNEEARQSNPSLFESWRGSWDVKPDGGESLAEFDARILRGMQRIVSANRGGCVVVVAHVMPIRGFLRRAFDGGIAAYWRPQIAPCSISILRCWGDEAFEIVTANSTAHL